MTDTPERLAQLHAAYPQGYLRRGGTCTLTGWVCTRVDDEGGSVWVHNLLRGARYLATVIAELPDGVNVFGPCGLARMRRGPDERFIAPEGWEGDLPDPRKPLLDGDLLPNLSDPLTFQAALIDLAEAIGWGVTGNLAWFKNSLGFWDLQTDGFTFATADPKKRTFCSFDTHDPIEALLLARAGLHSKKPTPP